MGNENWIANMYINWVTWFSEVQQATSVGFVYFFRYKKV